MAEAIKMQFGVLSLVGPGNLWKGIFGGVWLSEKHCEA